jgi:hypothetical protein
MKVLWICLLISAAVSAQSQMVLQPAEEPQSRVSIADFGLVYPLSNDWVRATKLMRARLGSGPAQNFDVLLAAVYVPKSDISATNPFFSLLAYRQPATNCKRSLEATIAQSQDKKNRAEGSVVEFSAAGRDYFRVNMTRGGRHQCVICTAASGHLLVWNAGAPNEKGLDSIVSTLDLITELPPRQLAASAQATRSYLINTETGLAL